MTRWWLALLIAVGLVNPAHGKPDLTQELGPTIAERGSAFYRFETLELASADGERHYRVWIGQPQRPAPAAGYPVIYLLDGNAAMGALDEAQLGELDREDPPVIVAIGYVTPLRFDVTARAYDYTPPLPSGEPVIDDLARERKGGGAELFLDFIEGQVKPAVQARLQLDLGRQTLWGHSYGGLLVLHSLFTRPQNFQAYAAADPSLWWQQGFLLGEEAPFAARPHSPKRLLLMRGAAQREKRAPRPGVDAQMIQARQAALAAVPVDALRQMATRLARVPGLQVTYREFPDLGHGPLLPASIGPALRLAMTPRDGEPTTGPADER